MGTPVRLALEASGTFMSGGTGVRVEAKKVASFPAHSFGAVAGIEVPFSW
jgi:hypothetical protein